MPSPAPAEVMDITNMLNTKAGSAAIPHVIPHHAISQNTLSSQIPDHHQLHHHHQHQHHHLSHAHHSGLMKPDPAMERPDSPHDSDRSHFSAPRSVPDGLADFHRYPSPSMNPSMQFSDPSLSPLPMMLPGLAPEVPNMAPLGSHFRNPEMPQLSPQAGKTYSCSTCSKGFSRRSDLARHERIHSGVRPHNCETCGKSFIQRSALTVHKRVHTGEKPHKCQICSKPFSDSSSLARHRRIHFGYRPFKCPYAHCQKTFTRRTTLTRHKAHHSGSVEESVAYTAAALASNGKNKSPLNQARSDSDLSHHESPMSTPSPAQRPTSMSPNMDLGHHSLGRHNDFAYLANTSIPIHMRNDIHTGSPTSTSSGVRPTSHPSVYGPPPILEPSIEPLQSGPGSAGGSPHLSNLGWQSPTSPHSSAGYSYPEPDYQTSASLGHLYYGAGGQLRRPQSADPGLLHMA